MITNHKTLALTVGAVAATVGTFFAGRSMWRGINTAKPVGLIVLAIVAYHVFDGYRESVDNAWGKVETAVERRELAEIEAKAKAEAEAKSAATAAFNAKKAEDMARAEAAYQAAYEAEEKEKGKRLLNDIEKLAKRAKATGKAQDINLAMAAWDDMMDWFKPFAEADGKKYQYEVERAKARAKMLAFITPKPAPKPKQRWQDDPIVEDAKSTEKSKVAEARLQLTKAKAVCHELYPDSKRFPTLCFGVAREQLKIAENKLATVLMEAN